MKETAKGTWVAEWYLEEKKQEFAEYEKRARQRKKAAKAAKKATKAAIKAAKPERKKWFGII